MDGEAGFLREQGCEARKAMPTNARTGVSCESSERPAMDGRAGLRAEQGVRSEKCGPGYLMNDYVSPWMATWNSVNSVL